MRNELITVYEVWRGTFYERFCYDGCGRKVVLEAREMESNPYVLVEELVLDG
jgi:hypothetical protein